jgi:preprotein translocase subunit YajC
VSCGLVLVMILHRIFLLVRAQSRGEKKHEAVRS